MPRSAERRMSRARVGDGGKALQGWNAVRRAHQQWDGCRRCRPGNSLHHLQRQLGRRGGRRQQTGRQRDAQLGQTSLGGLAGEVDAPDGAPDTAGALEDVMAEGALVEGRPVEARGRRRSRLAARRR